MQQLHSSDVCKIESYDSSKKGRRQQQFNSLSYFKGRENEKGKKQLLGFSILGFSGDGEERIKRAAHRVEALRN